MTASRGMALILVGLFAATAGTARAQGIGLQLADTTEARPQWTTEFTGGVLFNSDLSYYGGRIATEVAEPLRLFFDLGMNDLETGNDIGLQAGAIYCLPDEFSSNLGIRTAIYGLNSDDIDVLGLTAMFLSSGETVFDGIYLYGGLGVDLNQTQVKTDANDDTESDVNPALAGGALFTFNSRFSAYAEVDYVDGFFIGLGLRIR